MSPILFSLFLNDLSDFFENSDNIDGISCHDDHVIDNAHNFLKIFLLLYADDTVLLSESEHDLQNLLNVYSNYCDEWKLTVNISKSKVMVFSKGRPATYNFKYKNECLDVVSEYKYLGILFGRSGSFYKAKSHIALQATRASYSLLRKVLNLRLPLDLQIDVFNKTIKPILLYGSEMWGFGSFGALERVQLRYLKYILKLKRTTSNCMVYGETGCFPISIDIQTRLISFWSQMCIPQRNKLSNQLYKIMYNKYTNTDVEQRKIKFPWIDAIKETLVKCGFSGIWETQNFPNHNWLKSAVNHKLRDLYINEWHLTLQTSSNSNIYRIFKTNFGFEEYLKETSSSVLYYMLKFRTRNHHLPVEKGNWAKIPLHQRICPICKIEIGDEFHYLLKCSHFSSDRKKYIKAYYYNRPNVFKFEQLLNTKNKKEFHKLANFIKTLLLILK